MKNLFHGIDEKLSKKCGNKNNRIEEKINKFQNS
jgi:hypothetical protein